MPHPPLICGSSIGGRFLRHKFRETGGFLPSPQDTEMLTHSATHNAARRRSAGTAALSQASSHPVSTRRPVATLPMSSARAMGSRGRVRRFVAIILFKDWDG